MYMYDPIQENVGPRVYRSCDNINQVGFYTILIDDSAVPYSHKNIPFSES